MIRVVCGLIFKKNKILICRRKIDRALGGHWEFPGGKLELNETEKECLQRELKEELGMTVMVNQHFKSVEHEYANTRITLIAYRCVFQKASFKMIDHDTYKWVETENLLNWKLAPADIPIARELIETTEIT